MRRLGVYVDTVYRSDGDDSGRVYTNSEVFPFLRFVGEVGEHFDELVLFGRGDPGGEGADHLLPNRARLVGLPHYANLARGMEVLRAVPGTLRAMWRGLGGVDLVWVFGPYPFSPFLILFALLRGKRVVLGVRQDTMKYFRSRLPSRLAAPVLAPLWLVDRLFHVLAVRLPTVVVGGHLERQYGGPRAGLLALRISLVRGSDVVRSPPALDWSGRVRMLTVGRVEPEKNPLLLVEAMAHLEREEPGRYHLTWVGEGKLLQQARDHAARLGLEEVIAFKGFLPFGPGLLEVYRGSHLFLHVAVTEAFGQVLTEAMACGVPIIATDVGGVAWAVDGGRAGRLIPPRDVGALVEAVREVCGSAEARDARVAHGLRMAAEHTLEAEALRVGHLASEA